MTKELFVSSTPHETRVGLVEDDQLAEIYLERENEYTLAGSIYKGRVTRVLPGMQSAFVDIGLERDAFLYVSDFMELEDQDELDEVPTDRTSPAPEPRHQQQHQRDEAHLALPEAQATVSSELELQQPQADAGQQPSESDDTANSGNRERGGWRGRRRRRGRRGERMPDSKFARPAGEAQREPPQRTEPSDRPERSERPDRNDHPERNERPERSNFGPPPGYQPMILPGESISKYSRLAQAQAAAPARAPSPMPSREIPAPPIAETFPEDEPLFAKPVTEDRRRLAPPRPQAPTGSKPSNARREQERFEDMNVAAIFGGGATESEEQSHEESDDEEDKLSPVGEHSDQFPSAAAGTMEEEEIEEEEADLAAYVEELEEDEAFEELEEETHAAADYHETAQEIAAVGDPGIGISEPLAAEPSSSEPGVAEVVEEDETDEVEAELDEAQAEAEAVVEAETVGGTVDARAEVRAPAATAPYTQRAPRPAFDRNRGRRGGGGRRFRRNEPQNVPLITDLLKEGQEILVQIAKEPIGKKGARITSHIALPGRFLVYMPTVNHTGVSRKISSEDERQRLKRIIISERENGHGGFIVRTAAQGAAEEDLRADIRFLKGLWSEIKSRADNGKGPTLIYHDLNVVERVLRDQVSSDFSAIWVDNEQEYERILRFANRFQPALVKRVKLYTKDTPLYDQFGLNEEINKALKSKVWLKSGGYIVINQTEALVAIDVNTGKYVGKTARLEDTIVKTHVDAIKEIVRQIRLRDLGGIIVIDFIDMDERRNRQKVMQALEEALRGDRAPSKVLQFNDFGLVAITRKRVKQSLERTIGTPCPYCQSTGFVKSVTTICNEIYLEMRKIAKHLEHSDVLLRVNPEVAKALKANNGRALTEMEELTKRTVIVKSDPAVHQEQFDIN
jgi:Rne/Rng family ribonuclease